MSKMSKPDPPGGPPACTPSSPYSSQSCLFSGLVRISQACDSCLNLSESPPLSGCSLRAFFLKALRIQSVVAFLSTPRRLQYYIVSTYFFGYWGESSSPCMPPNPPKPPNPPENILNRQELKQSTIQVMKNQTILNSSRKFRLALNYYKSEYNNFGLYCQYQIELVSIIIMALRLVAYENEKSFRCRRLKIYKIFFRSPKLEHQPWANKLAYLGVMCEFSLFLGKGLYCFNLIERMKSYVKNNLPMFSPSSGVSDPTSPVLHDSRSSTNLYQSLQQPKKFRETTFFPNSTKNNNRQFLRYTVNLNKTEKEVFSNQVAPLDSLRSKRKLTVPDSPPFQILGQDSTCINSKPSSATKKYEKRNSNPERKEQLLLRPSPVPKFLQKRTPNEEKVVDSTAQTFKTQRANSDKFFLHNLSTKKTFTPKCNKYPDEPSSATKIMSSYSSKDLHKLNNLNSPTCQSRTSQAAVKNLCFDSGPNIDQFKKIKFLGEGKFGQVHLVVHKETCAVYALKQIKKQSVVKNKMENQLLMQIKMQLYINHPNILKLYGVFNDQDSIYMILQYMEEGTLYSQLKKKKTLKQEEASKKLRDILDAVGHLHNQMIAHRDIKPQNIVMSYDVCKICDLGWAAVCEDRRKTLCGTIDYASPELLEGKQYGIAIDLWCLGVLCYELMVGKCPFYHISRKETMKKIINADLSDLNLPATIPFQTKDFIEKLLKKDPEERMNAQNALRHPLITKYFDEDFHDIRHQKRRS